MQHVSRATTESMAHEQCLGVEWPSYGFLSHTCFSEYPCVVVLPLFLCGLGVPLAD